MSAPAAGEAPYDRRARIYDRLVGNALDNRLGWGTHPRRYAAFADEALASGTGPFLDAGCGSAVFTAAAHRPRAGASVRWRSAARARWR